MAIIAKLKVEPAPFYGYLLFDQDWSHSFLHRTTLVVMCQANIVMQYADIIIEQSAIDFMSQPQLMKAPTWLRVLQVSIGAISIILSGYVLAQPGLAIFTAISNSFDSVAICRHWKYCRNILSFS